MNTFDFYLRGFSTRYTAVPREQTYAIFAGEEDTGLYYEQGYMTSMMERQVIVKVFDKEKIDEAA